VLRAAQVGTAVFVATAVAATAAPRPFGVAAFLVAVTLFLAGCGAFMAAYFRGVARSRTEDVGIAGLYLLSGSAPTSTRRMLLGAVAVQVLVAVATAAARPNTGLAAGTLVPMYGLGLCGFWSSRHGTFPPRPPGPRRSAG